MRGKFPITFLFFILLFNNTAFAKLIGKTFLFSVKEIKCRSLSWRFTPDFLHVACFGRVEKGWGFFLDGKKITEFSKPVSISPFLTKDGKHFAFLAYRGRDLFVFHDDKIYGPYKEVTNLILSKDGSRAGYTATRDGRVWEFAINGKAVRKEEGVRMSFLAVSSDLKNYAYSITKFTERGSEKWVVFNGRRFGPYTNLKADIFTFSSDGTKFLYAARAAKWGLYLNGKAIGKFLYLIKAGFSPDSKRIFYAPVIRGKAFVFVDEKKFGPYNNVWTFKFSKDSKHFAFIAEKNGKLIAFLDGKKKGEYRKIRIRYLRISDRGGHIAYIAEKKIGGENVNLIVHDGREIFRTKYRIGSIAISPDGSKVAYTVRYIPENVLGVYVNEKELGRYKGLFGLFFSPNSKNLGYFAVDLRMGLGRRACMDGKCSKNAFDRILKIVGIKKMIFIGDRTVRFFAIKEKKLYRIEEKL